jgi:flagellar hook-associated protein 3 FlgL
MVTNLDPSSAIYVANLNRIEQALATANEQISSGRKINVASDAPDEIGPLLQLRADLQHNTQIQSNLTLAKTDATAADNALNGAAQLMDNAVQLAAQGANSTQTADTRSALAQQVQALQEQMVAYSQTQVEGRYIFSGDSDQSPAYQVDLNAAKGVDQLSSAAATQRIENPAGGSFAASKTAQQIFDTTTIDGNGNVIPAPDNVFNALNTLRLALLANDQQAITSSTDLLHQAADQLDSMDSFYGTVENRIDDASSFAGNYDTQLQTQISGKEDTDIPTAAMEMTQANTQLQAAFTIEGKMPQTTLFSYLG